MEFPFYFTSIWHYLLLLTIAASLFLTLAILLFKRDSFKRVSVSVFTLGFLFWLQGNLLVWDYGVFDGRDIIWSDYFLNGVIDTTVWLIFIIGFTVKYTIVYRFIRQAVFILIIMQLGGLTLTAYFAPAEAEWKGTNISHETMFDFSTEKNVIILVQDMFQADVFQQIINEDESYKDIFDGFTFYRNATGGYPTTYPTIAHMLTGDFYDNSIPIQDYIANISKKENLPLLLMQNNFNAEIYPMVQKAFHLNDKNATNISSQKTTENDSMFVINLYELTLFRHMPHFLKNQFYMEPADAFTLDHWVYDLEFKVKLLDESGAYDISPRFKFYHLFYPHNPFQLNEALEYEELPQNREGFLIQSRASLKITEALLDKLREIGVYDNSMIFVVSDHGYRDAVDGKQLPNNIIENKTLSLVDPHVKASGLPLIMFKPFSSTGELEISDAPVSLKDIPKTISDLMNIEHDFPGYNILNIGESEIRERRYLYYDWTEEYHDWSKEYLPPMYEYVVTGHSWLDSSWKPTNRSFTAEGIKDATPEPYIWGDSIFFNKEGNAEQYYGGGWGSPESKGTWSDDYTATLAVPVDSTKANLEMEINLTPFIKKGIHDKQVVKIFANESLVDERIFTEGGKQEQSVVIPNEFIVDGMLYLTFQMPNAISPLELDISEDSRMLGINVSSIVINESIPVTSFNTETTYRIDGLDEFMLEGWSAPEEEFIWSDGKKAVLSVPTPDDEKDVRLDITFHAFVEPENNLYEQNIIIYANDQKLNEKTITDNEVKELRIELPNRLVSYPSTEIIIETPNATSPKEIGLSDDERKLGIAIHSITIDK